MTTCYLKTNNTELYKKRTEVEDYDMQLFSENIIQVSKQTVRLDLNIKLKMVDCHNHQIPFFIIPDDYLATTPVIFTTSPLFINNKEDYYTVSLYVTNLSGYTFNIPFGKPVAKLVLLTRQFKLVLE
jgi:hypothetical protein